MAPPYAPAASSLSAAATATSDTEDPGWGGDFDGDGDGDRRVASWGGKSSAPTGAGPGGVFGGRGRGEVHQARYSRAAQATPVPVLRRRWVAAVRERGSGDRRREGGTPSASGSVPRGVGFPSGEVGPSPAREYFG